MSSLAQARVPIKFMASLFAAGNEGIVEAVYRRLIAVRLQTRSRSVGDVTAEEAGAALTEAGLTAEMAEAIFRLTARPTFEERFVMPPLAREVAVESTENPYQRKSGSGFGRRKMPERGL
jgi:nitrate reductase / nitrite oxidoreductase, beta subunit